MLTSVQNVCVVTTFYTLEGMKSILLPEFVFFRSRLRLSLKNTNSLFFCFIFILRGCCTSYYNIPSSLYTREPYFLPPKVHLFFLTSTAFVGTNKKQGISQKRYALLILSAVYFAVVFCVIVIRILSGIYSNLYFNDTS